MDNSVSTSTARRFYQNLGKLFYAIAAADNVVNGEEIKTLVSLVNDKWVEVDQINDEFGSDVAYQIAIIFDWLQETNSDANEIFGEFEEYKKEHENLFDPKTNELIYNTAERIAASFAGKEQEELEMLSRLKILLQQ